MQTVEHSSLINIVNAWTEKNSPAITDGLKVGSPIELLKFERLLLSLLIQLGAMIIKEHPELACPGVAYRLAVMLQDMSRLEAHKRLRKERDNEKVF